jgi:hypothetical protein
LSLLYRFSFSGGLGPRHLLSLAHLRGSDKLPIELWRGHRNSSRAARAAPPFSLGSSEFYSLVLADGASKTNLQTVGAGPETEGYRARSLTRLCAPKNTRLRAYICGEPSTISGGALWRPGRVSLARGVVPESSPWRRSIGARANWPPGDRTRSPFAPSVRVDAPILLPRLVSSTLCG